MALTDAQHRLLSAAAQHPQGLVARLRLPPAARRTLVHSLLTRGLLAEADAPGGELALRITAAGLAAIEASLPVPPRPRASLQEAVRAVLAAWDDPHHTGLLEAMAIVQAIVRRKGTTREPGQPRTNTKRQVVLELMRREEGATIAQIATATGWQAHTVRGFLANLKRKGTPVSVLERVRQAGVARSRGKGSFSIYRLADAP